MSDEKNKDKRWFYWIVILIAIIVIIVVCWFFFRGSETYTSDSPGAQKTVAIECVSGGQDESFFADNRVEEVSHKIKGTFKNDILDRISYDYDALFSSDTIAETNHAVFHGQYNKYMASKNINPDSLQPSFSSSGSSVKITLITNASKLSNENIQFFFLNMDDFQRIKSYNPRELAKLYQEKGFSCEIHD